LAAGKFDVTGRQVNTGIRSDWHLPKPKHWPVYYKTLMNQASDNGLMTGEVFAKASAAAPTAVYFAKNSLSHPTSTDQNENHGDKTGYKIHLIGHTVLPLVVGVFLIIAHVRA
jgi:hypothetical protein